MLLAQSEFTVSTDAQVWEFHKAANLFPLMVGAEFDELCKSIADGYDYHFPIITYQGKILDGRNRYNACLQTITEPVFDEYTGNDPIGFVVRANIDRRHLTSSQRAVIALDLEKMFAEEARERILAGKRIDPGKIISQGRASEQAAQALGTNAQYVKDAKKIAKEAPDLLDRVRAGELIASKAIQILRKRQAVEHLESIETKEAKAIQGIYDVIVIDPPWPMEKIERDVAPNQVAFDYPTMTLDEIGAMKIPAADNCHVWLWTTQKYLPAALDILKMWGAKYVCNFVWHKPGGFQPFELPQYNCEFALYARIGSPIFIDLKDFMTCFNAPRGGHSEKPEEFYKIVRRVTAGRRIDMFGRRAIEGFDTWGKEAC